jgi:CPA1 family monovalent cation:H+ antiporter
MITVTFGVVLVSILLQGLTMKPLLKRLGIARGHEARRMYEVRSGELRMTQAGLDEIEHMERRHLAPDAVLSELREEYEARAREVTATVEALRVQEDDLRAEESVRARRQILLAEKESVLADFHRGALNAEAYNRLLGAVDARLVKLDAGASPGDTENP